MEPAAGHEGPGGPGPDDAVKGCWMSPARRTYPLAKMDPSIMKTTFRFGSPCQLTAMLLLLYCLTVSGGRAAGSVGSPPAASAAEAIVSDARLSLAEARKTQSDPRTAVGHYLDAGD